MTLGRVVVTVRMLAVNDQPQTTSCEMVTWLSWRPALAWNQMQRPATAGGGGSEADGKRLRVYTEARGFFSPGVNRNIHVAPPPRSESSGEPRSAGRCFAFYSLAPK